MDVERFRAEMNGEQLLASIVRARDAKRLELQTKDPKARLNDLDPGPRTTSKCLGVLISIFSYACDDHRLLLTIPRCVCRSCQPLRATSRPSSSRTCSTRTNCARPWRRRSTRIGYRLRWRCSADCGLVMLSACSGTISTGTAAQLKSAGSSGEVGSGHRRRPPAGEPSNCRRCWCPC